MLRSVHIRKANAETDSDGRVSGILFEMQDLWPDFGTRDAHYEQRT